jgi:hypothetical protein
MANTKNIVDVLEEAGITWRAYAEDCELPFFISYFYFLYDGNTYKRTVSDPIHQGCYLGGTPEANGKSVPHCKHDSVNYRAYLK